MLKNRLTNISIKVYYYMNKERFANRKREKARKVTGPFTDSATILIFFSCQFLFKNGPNVLFLRGTS